MDLSLEITDECVWIDDNSALYGLIHLLSINEYKQRTTIILISESPLIYVAFVVIAELIFAA